MDRDAREVERSHQKVWSSKRAGERVAGLGKLAWRETSKELVFSAKLERAQAFRRRSELRESLLTIWRTVLSQVWRMCQDPQAEVGPSEVSSAS